jgi:dTDP-4-dehydrorhamnose 3,5-epimerase
MNCTIKTYPIAGLKLLTPKKVSDNRGFFSETYNAEMLAELGILERFVQDNHSLSMEKGTVRGLHYQNPPHAQAKLVRVSRGSILDVVVDIRRGSPTYGQHVAEEISAENWSQLYIPIGFAHGFCTLTPDAELQYKVSDYYSPTSDAGFLWDDADLGIAWPDFAGTQLSPKDVALPRLADIDSPFEHA